MSSVLSIIASNETAGRYYCKAQSIGFPEISAEALVILKGPPKILSPAEQYPTDEQTYEIECVAFSIPKAKHVSWAFNGILIDLDKDLGFSLREEYLPEGIKSTLRIEENLSQHFGTYSCFVINKYGSDTLDILFSRQSEKKIQGISIPCGIFYAYFSNLLMFNEKFSGEIPMVLLASGAGLILLIFIAGALAISFCMRLKKRTLPPADIIPKVMHSLLFQGERKFLKLMLR